MESLDHLRMHFAHKLASWKMSREEYDEIAPMLDAVESEHREDRRKAVDKAHADGERSGLKQARSASEDYRRGRKDALEEIAETHIELPKDADGDHIHLADEVMRRDHAGKWSGPLPVMALTDVGCYVRERGVPVPPLVHVWGTDLRRFREQAVEDVLREMLDVWGELPSDATSDAIVAEYAERLQLKEES